MTAKNQTSIAQFSIGEAAKASGVTAKMIRHYEEIGLMPPAKRTLSNYRTYSMNDVFILRFIKQGRKLGFSNEKTKLLTSLWQNHNRSSAEVKSLVLEHLSELEKSIQEMQAIYHDLKHLADCCQGDEKPECPIINSLVDGVSEK